MYSNDEKTEMILIYGGCNKNASAVARLCRQKTFSQNLFVFSQFPLTKRNDVYVKIYETSQLTMFHVFINQKTNIQVNFGNMYTYIVDYIFNSVIITREIPCMYYIVRSNKFGIRVGML
jgi:hypothetical protein